MSAPLSGLAIGVPPHGAGRSPRRRNLEWEHSKAGAKKSGDLRPAPPLLRTTPRARIIAHHACIRWWTCETIRVSVRIFGEPRLVRADEHMASKRRDQYAGKVHAGKAT